MKICKIYIKGFQQFQDVELDFTNLETGEPANKICFIGSNGTGKTKLLNLIFDFFGGGFILDEKYRNGGYFIKVLHDNSFFTFIYFGSKGKFTNYESDIEQDFINLNLDDFKKKHSSMFDAFQDFNHGVLSYKSDLKEYLDKLLFISNEKNLLIFSPSESVKNDYLSFKDVPETNVNEALSLNKNFEAFHTVSPATVNKFWKILVFNLKKRDEERAIYETDQKNINKTKAQLIKEFDSINPTVLETLGRIWDKILNKAGLTFDVKGANNPIQLTDNLKAYIKLQKGDEIIPYSELSTGIRNYIFRVGHIFSLYFNREIDRGFLLVDEPENSLYPDFLFELVEIYNQVIKDKRGQNNTQMFFATHNPIIAAQFKPYERIILDWKEDGTVRANKGITPEGDDPNDILKKDFGLHQLMGSVGINQWNKYLVLKKKLKQAATNEEKMEIASEINEIGRLYNFPA